MRNIGEHGAARRHSVEGEAVLGEQRNLIRTSKIGSGVVSFVAVHLESKSAY